MSDKLIPPDPNQCQAEKLSGSFMTLGPRSMVRCTNVPTVIAQQKEAGEDGLIGSMSLCDDCRQAFIRMCGEDAATIYKIKERKTP